MHLPKLLIIFILQICLSTILAAPKDEEAHQELKIVINYIKNQISIIAKWKMGNCHENPEFPDQAKPLEMLENLMKKLKKPKENLKKSDVDNVLDIVEEYSGNLEQIMTKIIKSLKIYQPKWQFDEAIRVEKTQQNIQTLQIGTLNELNRAKKYLNLKKLRNIRNHFEMVNILQKLKMTEKQEEYAKYFLMYFYTKKDLQNEIENIEKDLDKMPQECGEISDKMCELASKPCHDCLYENAVLHCCYCPMMVAYLAIHAVSLPAEIACCIQRKSANKKIQKNEQKISKIDEDKRMAEKQMAKQD